MSPYMLTRVMIRSFCHMGLEFFVGACGEDLLSVERKWVFGLLGAGGDMVPWI